MIDKTVWIALAAVLALAGCNKPAPAAQTAMPSNAASVAAPFTPSYASGGTAPAATPTVAPADGSAAQPTGALPSDLSSPTPAEAATFNAAFDRGTHDSCVTSAESNGLPPDGADKYCSCVVARLEPLSVQEKLALPQHHDVIVAAATACRSQ